MVARREENGVPGGGRHAPLRLALTVDLEAQPVVGTLRAESGEEESFTGWLGLAAALEALRHREHGSPAT